MRGLSAFLTALHRFPALQAERCLVPVYTAPEWRQRYVDFYARIRERIFPLLDEQLQSRARGLWEAFLSIDDLFQFAPVLIHGDLGAEHILCDPETGSIRGVIDWEDTVIGDPALDFAGFLSAFGPDFARRVAAGYGLEIDIGFWRRAAFYAKIAPFYGIEFGLTTKDERHVQSGLESLAAVLAGPSADSE